MLGIFGRGIRAFGAQAVRMQEETPIICRIPRDMPPIYTRYTKLGPRSVSSDIPTQWSVWAVLKNVSYNHPKQSTMSLFRHASP